MGIVGIENDVDAAAALILVEHLLPGLSTVDGAKNSSLGIRPIGVPKRSNENNLGIPGINDYCADMPAVAQADILPGLPAIGG